MTENVSYDRAQLREAQSLFRKNEQSRAFELALALHKKYPKQSDVTKFYTATARYIMSMVSKNVRAENHDLTVYYSRMLLEDPTFRNTAQQALLEAARAGFSPRVRVEILHPLCKQETTLVSTKIADIEPYWREIGFCIGDLPPCDSSISLGFEVLSVLPGYEVALNGLMTLIAQDQGGESEALSQLTVASVVDAKSIDSFASMLGERIDPTMDIGERRVVYASLRREALQNADEQASSTQNKILLALELAIHNTERSIGGKFTRDDEITDAWSLLDPTSQYYALREQQVPFRSSLDQLRTEPQHIKRRCEHAMHRPAVIASLWLHSMNREASQDRLGYFWLVVDPIIQVLVICIIPLILHPEQIYDMPTLPFAVIGACVWLVFRASAIGAISGGGVLKPQLKHPVIRKFDIMVARSISALANYSFAAAGLLGVAVFMGLTEGPEHLPFFVLCFMLSWIFGLSYGIVCNSLIKVYPGLKRLNIYLLRIIGLMSALLYTPEQLPEAIVAVIWYNPLLHVVQLARTYWFANYTSLDASVTYIFFWAAILALVALMFLIIDDKRPEAVNG